MDKERKNLKVFGYGLTVLLAFWGVRHGLKSGWTAGAALALAGAVALLVITFARVESLKPLYVRWLKVAHLIGSIISTVILTLLYGLAFTSTGLILRLAGKDLLSRKIDGQLKSYWVKRPDESRHPRSYLKQF